MSAVDLLNGAASRFPSPIRETSCSDSVWEVASTALKYTVLASVAGASGFLWTAGGWSVVTVVLGTGFYVLHTVIATLRDVRGFGNLTIEEKAARVDQIARRLFRTALVFGAIVLGVGVANLFQGSNLLASGIVSGSGKDVVFGIYHATNALGNVLPFALTSLRIAGAANNLYERGFNFIQGALSQDNWPAILVQALEVGQERVPLSVLYAVSEFLPQDTINASLRYYLSTQEHEQIMQTISQFPNVCTLQFLAMALPEDKFRRVAEQILGNTTQETLDGIGQQLDQIEGLLNGWEARYADELQRNALRAEIEPAVASLVMLTNTIGGLRNQIQLLGQAPLPYPDRYANLQVRIDTLRGLREPCHALHVRLFNNVNGSLRQRLLSLSSRLAPRDQPDDLTELSYETLGSYGFSIASFNELGAAIGVQERGIEPVFAELERRGLGTRGDLVNHGILEAPLTVDLLHSRIVAFCQGNLPVGQVAEAIIDADMHRIGFWERSARVVNTVFHHTLSLSLMTVQLVYQPFSTAAGVAYQFVYDRHWSPIFFMRRWETSPNYISASFTERCREIFLRTAPIVTALSLGSVGGFLIGMEYGLAARTRSATLNNFLNAVFPGNPLIV